MAVGTPPRKRKSEAGDEVNEKRISLSKKRRSDCIGPGQALDEEDVSSTCSSPVDVILTPARRRRDPAFFSPVPLSQQKRRNTSSSGGSVVSLSCAEAGWRDNFLEADSDEVADSDEAPLAVEQWGVPDRLRREAWRAWTRRRYDFDDDCDYDAAFLASSREDCLLNTQLDKDVRRTLGDMEYFRDGDGALVLKRVLGAAALAEPSLGYVQGMNYVAAYVLVAFTHCDSVVLETPRAVEVVAYSTVRGLNRLVRGYYDSGFTMLFRDVAVLEEALKTSLPETSAALTASGVDPLTYAPRFLVPLFLNALPGAVNVRLWDVMLARTSREEADEEHSNLARHSNMASAHLLWALLAVLSLASPKILLLQAENEGTAASIFTELQDAILTAALTVTSWDRLKRAAPMTCAEVADAIQHHDTNAKSCSASTEDDAKSCSSTDVVKRNSGSSGEEFFPQTNQVWRSFEYQWLGENPSFNYTGLLSSSSTPRISREDAPLLLDPYASFDEVAVGLLDPQNQAPLTLPRR